MAQKTPPNVHGRHSLYSIQLNLSQIPLYASWFGAGSKMVRSR